MANPTHLVYNCSTGEVSSVEWTDAEVAANLASAAAGRAAHDAVEAARVLSKLEKLQKAMEADPTLLDKLIAVR
jgi:hypothetical protein